MTGDGGRGDPRQRERRRPALSPANSDPIPESPILNRLWRQRRRVVLATLALLVALTAAMSENVAGQPAGFVALFLGTAAILSFLLALVVVALLTWLLPRLTGLVEMFLIFSVLLSAVRLLIPVLGPSFAPWAEVVGLMAFLIYLNVVTSDSLDHLGRTRVLTRRRVLRLAMAPQAALNAALAEGSYPGTQVFRGAGG